MWHKKLKITYVDGEVLEIDTSGWESARSDGVDYIDFLGGQQHSGESIYYMYPETINEEGEIAWVCGSFSVYQSSGHESIMRINGECMGRKRRTMPDVKHSQVKLGWWRQDAGT